MNMNDLPPAARIASLIEAGRAAYPELKQATGGLMPTYYSACALGFACLGAGVSKTKLRTFWTADAYLALDFPMESKLMESVWKMNDQEGKTLEEICHELREGAVATIASECNK